MAIKSYKLTDGILYLGALNALNVSAQLRSGAVKWSEEVSSIDAIPVLNGEEIPEEQEATYKATFSGKFLQDLDAAGLVDWSWDNKGTEQPFLYVPNVAEGRGVEGVLVPIPLDVGGEVTKPANRPESDFEWRIIGDPVFGVFAPGGAGVADDTVTEDI